MASTTLAFFAPPGLTLTVELYAEGSDTIANGAGDTCTEATNRDGYYTATVTEALAGLHTVNILSGATSIGSLWVTLVDDTGTYYGLDSVNLLTATQASIDAIEADTNELQTDDIPTTLATLATAANLATVDTNVDAILVDTGTTLPATLAALNDVAATDIVSAGPITTLAGAVVNVTTVATTTTNTDMRGTDSAATAAALATVDTNVDAILVDTGTTLPATLATAQADLDIITGATGVNLLTATQASIDAIEADTNELQVDDVPGLIAALNNVSVADILTTQMTEAYAADGAAPTIAQALCAIQQFLQEKTVSGTTMTIKKLDGSTTAMTFTLNDATNPTNLTRAT